MLVAPKIRPRCGIGRFTCSQSLPPRLLLLVSTCPEMEAQCSDKISVGYDTSVIGGTMALDSFKRDFGLVDREQHAIDTLQGNIVSTFQAGTFFGALLSFPLAERIGRKRSIMIAALVFLVGGAIMVRRPRLVIVPGLIW
jgi:MFS family permease